MVAVTVRWVRSRGSLGVSIAAVTAPPLGARLLEGRVFGLPPSHALRVAAGNAICGNSAIAAVATVTRARREETAAAVAYTALLSLALVLALPLVRVLMRIPLVTGLSPHRRRATAGARGAVALRGLIPWYVLGCVAAAASRSSGVVTDRLAAVAQLASHALTIISMAALGLGAEIELLRRVGWRTAATPTFSLLTQCALAAAVVRWLPASAR